MQVTPSTELSPSAASVTRCEVCGNSYDKMMQIHVPTSSIHEGGTWWFDSFECAMHMLAPSCAHCGCRILGHGVEQDGRIFCCAHCARESGATGLKDRA